MRNLRRYFNNLVYIILGIFYLSAIYFWLYLNDFQTAHVDDTIYLTRAYDFYNYAQESIIDFLKEIFIIQKHKPPLLVYILSSLVWICGSENTEFLIISYVLIINLVFLINLKFFFDTLFPKKERARNITLILFFLSPLMFGVSKLLMTELLLLNLILILASLIHRWQDSMNGYKAFTLGILSALGLLSKATFIFYSAGIFIYLFKEKKFFRNSNFKYFFLGSLIALPWYSLNFFRVIGKFISAYNFERHTDGPIYLPTTLVNYSFDLIMGFGFFSSLIFLCFFLTGFQTLSNYYKDLYIRYLFCAPLFMFLMFFFVNNKNERFQYVSFFFLILIIALISCQKINSLMCKFFIWILLSLQAFLFYQQSFSKNFSWIPPNRVLYVTRPYKFFLDNELTKEISMLLKMDLLDLHVSNLVYETGIEAEFQEEKRNPRSIIYNLKLLKSKAGHYGMAVDKEEDHIKDKNFNRDYLLYVDEINSEISIKDNELVSKYKYLRTLDQDSNMKIRFDLYRMIIRD